MHVITIPVTRLVQNCSLVICKQTKKSVLIDPGGDVNKIDDHIKKYDACIVAVLLTHLHADHCSAAPYFSTIYNVPIYGSHKADQIWLDALNYQKIFLGVKDYGDFTVDRWLDDGDIITFGQQTFHVIFAPGHTPGHIVFYHKCKKKIFVGDVMFNGSVGRTDFPGSSHKQLMDSIHLKLLPLGDDVIFYPGHGSTSSFGEQRSTNSFLVNS